MWRTRMTRHHCKEYDVTGKVICSIQSKNISCSATLEGKLIHQETGSHQMRCYAHLSTKSNAITAAPIIKI
eukprot:scaffold165813_cov46-Cyclotella_meneghiniana.AAC.2